MGLARRSARGVASEQLLPVDEAPSLGVRASPHGLALPGAGASAATTTAWARFRKCKIRSSLSANLADDPGQKCQPKR